jgi:hypothetical protein
MELRNGALVGGSPGVLLIYVLPCYCVGTSFDSQLRSFCCSLPAMTCKHRAVLAYLCHMCVEGL